MQRCQMKEGMIISITDRGIFLRATASGCRRFGHFVSMGSLRLYAYRFQAVPREVASALRNE